MTTVAAVVVTHDAQAWIGRTLESIASQARRADRVVVIDDASTDATCDIVRSFGLDVSAATTTATDTTSRIAANFVQGVRAADADIVVLGDHDDVWHPDRIEHQAALLEQAPTALMVASDGIVVDAAGAPTGARLREAFPVPATWDGWSDSERMRHVLRRSVATGGASAVRPATFSDLAVPDGWLHDRWWSLVATARGGMLVDTDAVIDYRVQQRQEVGLDRAAQSGGRTRRVLALGSRLSSFRKYRDVRSRLRAVAATPEIAAEIRLSNLL